MEAQSLDFHTGSLIKQVLPKLMIHHILLTQNFIEIYALTEGAENPFKNSHPKMVKFTVKTWQMTKKHLGWGPYWFECVE